MSTRGRALAYVGHGNTDSGLTCECGKPALRRVTIPPDGKNGWRSVGFCKEHISQAAALSLAQAEKRQQRIDGKFAAGEWKGNAKWRPIVARNA